MKYDDLLARLNDEEIYSAGSIIRLAQETNYANDHESLLRIRVSLNRFSSLRDFPKTGDGWIRIKGQGLTPGWYGWRWKGKSGSASGEGAGE